MNTDKLIRQCTDSIDNVIYCEAVQSVPDGHVTVFVLHKEASGRLVSIFRNDFKDNIMTLVQSVPEPLSRKLSEVFGH